MVLNARSCELEILFIRQQPLLIGVLERCRQRRHDLATITQVSPHLGPPLAFADCFKASLPFNRLLQAIQIERALVDAGKAIEVVAILFVELGELIKIVVVDTVAAFDRIELLTSGPEVETLFQPHVSLAISKEVKIDVKCCR